ncbi:hypothetical protein WR25_02729 [Diploscapter pachys]|uniref:Protein kinase domain-containing protein n=1 Tax=Diploscapter pachys TaxID=2018661 RepID=A0A2A2JQY7_9BILA|nr:hypothetical protein WR25_02729 [Diploscapter pachys]
MSNETFQVGKTIILKGRTYTVSECLCDGVFSSVYLIEDEETQGTYAMKLEKQQGCERPVLKLDISVLQLMAGCRGFTALIDKGRTRHFKFLVMQRVGPSLADLQRKMPDKRFGPSTVYQIAAQTLERIHCLHTRGWLNRDIKASNFAVGIGHDCRQIYMIDFGLSRRFRKSDGVYLGQRGRGPCVGTWPFCPLASNAGLDQMPIHDIEGWFYFIVFIYKGCLPWFKHAPLPRNTFCRDYKLFVRHVGRSQLLDGLPREWRCIFETITRRNYFELPDYAMYFDLLTQSAERKKINMQAPLDWEQSVTATPAAVEVEVLSSPFPLPVPEPVLLHGDVPDPLKIFTYKILSYYETCWILKLLKFITKMNITVDQLESITRSTIVGWIVFFNIFGLFGNTNLIAITLHEKELQTKSGLLLASNAFAHNIILLSEFISVSYHLSDQPIYRKDCFHSIAHFIFCMCFQAVVIFMMSLDILFAILFPIKYRLIDQNFKYLLKCLLLPIIYSCTIIIVSFVYLNDNKIPFCNPPLAMPSEACRAWSVSNMVINTATLISYSIVIIVFKYKRKQKT